MAHGNSNNNSNGDSFTDTGAHSDFDSSPDAPTVRQNVAGSDAPTHKIEPAAYVPLSVCPECSLAWETTSRWCPSCGTAFERSTRERTSATRVMPTERLPRPQAEPPLTRSARRRRESAARPPGPASPQGPNSGPPRRQRPSGSSGASARNLALALGVIALVAVAFLAGQSTRPSQGEVDASIEQAVATARQSAVSSYRTAFEKLQAEATAAIESARKSGRAEGESSAQQELESQQSEGRSLFDKVTDCLLNREC